MEILSTLLTIFFVIVCILLVIVILLQSNRSSGMSLFGGGSQSAFGAGTADVMTKVTTILIALFLGTALVVAYLKSAGSDYTGLQEEFQSTQPAGASEDQNGAGETGEPANSLTPAPSEVPKEGSENAPR